MTTNSVDLVTYGEFCKEIHRLVHNKTPLCAVNFHEDAITIISLDYPIELDVKVIRETNGDHYRLIAPRLLCASFEASRPSIPPIIEALRLFDSLADDIVNEFKSKHIIKIQKY